MTTKDIRTSHDTTMCDVCGRTLLRGEHAEVFINGGARHSVCELCKGRALHEGWIREGTLPEYDGASQSAERRRSIFGRLRHRREAADGGRPSLDAELSAPWTPPPVQPPVSSPLGTEAPFEPLTDGRDDGLPAGSTPEIEEPPARRSRQVRPPRTRAREIRDRAAARDGREGLGGREVREPRQRRHVRAVPTRDEQKIASAIAHFNESEHRRTVSGVARSLGLPVVSVLPDSERPSLVRLTVSWELCWYRYEVDLSDEVPTVRVEAQGYELTELSERERLPNAVSDDMGQLSLP